MTPAQVAQPEASDSATKLAELILSDCGHSTAITTQLRDRVARRIDKYTDALREAPQAEPPGLVANNGDVLWLWKNGEGFLAFKHLYPCFSPGGDPMTLGEPFARAEFRASHDRSVAPSAPTAVEPQTIVTERDPHPNAFMQVPKGTEIKAHWPSLVEPDERAMFEAWAKTQKFWTLHRDEFGEYSSQSVYGGWLAWQARASKGTK